jgi:hypothetical protein
VKRLSNFRPRILAKFPTLSVTTFRSRIPHMRLKMLRHRHRDKLSTPPNAIGNRSWVAHAGSRGREP